MLASRMLWKDWGFAENLSSQARHFVDLARQSTAGSVQEGYVRASIVFSLMSFEAYFVQIVRGYIQQNRATIDPASLAKVEDGLQKNTGIREALREWPKFLTGKSLDTRTKPYADFVCFSQYRNALLHGKITEKIPSWGKLAQEVETVVNAELAQQTVSEMVKAVASIFRLGFSA